MDRGSLKGKMKDLIQNSSKYMDLDIKPIEIHGKPARVPERIPSWGPEGVMGLGGSEERKERRKVAGK